MKATSESGLKNSAYLAHWLKMKSKNEWMKLEFKGKGKVKMIKFKVKVKSKVKAGLQSRAAWHTDEKWKIKVKMK